MTIGDTTVPKGDNMMVLLAAAQRDPAMYPEPKTFDPRFPQARLDSAPVYKLNVTLRGLSTLAVRV